MKTFSALEISNFNNHFVELNFSKNEGQAFYEYFNLQNEEYEDWFDEIKLKKNKEFWNSIAERIRL